jgi:hypothetical protein
MSSSESAGASKSAAKQSLTGYNYLTSGGGAQTIKAEQDAGLSAIPEQSRALSGEASALDAMDALLTGGPNSAAANTAYSNYLDSTGYKSRLDSGSRAITGNMASKGLLNSGATGKALTKYGQNLGGEYFTNYLNSLGAVANGRSNLATGYASQAAAGIDAVKTVGNAGTGAGSTAASYIQAGGNTSASGISNITGLMSNALPYLMQGSGSSNSGGKSTSNEIKY